MAESELIALSQAERDRLKVMAGVLSGQRTQVEAARLLDLSERQVRRIQRRLEARGDRGVIHGLRGKPSNRRTEPARKQKVLQLYREDLVDLDPTHASEKLAQRGLPTHPETLRLWLLEAELWKRQRRRDCHRTRRERRACLGVLVQMDASEHRWLEDRYAGEIHLLAMIDDATAPLVERHEAELAELEERVAQLGERGSGRKELVERQNREQRRYRADELRFGLTTLARRCRDELATSARPANVIDALAAIQRVSEGLIRNPNERLQLQALFVEIGTLGI